MTRLIRSKIQFSFVGPDHLLISSIKSGVTRSVYTVHYLESTLREPVTTAHSPLCPMFGSKIDPIFDDSITFSVHRIPRVNLTNSQSAPYGPDDGIPPTPPPTDRGVAQQARSKKRSQASRGTIARSPLIVDPLVNDATLYRMALFRNPALGYQRCAFIIQKVPALVLMFVSSWVLWGRGMKQERPGNEGSASIFAFVTGVFVLGSILFGSLDHNNSYFRAKIMTNLRHIFVLIGGCASTVVLILAASTIHPLDKEKNAKVQKNYTNFMADAFNYQERINNQAVLVGASVFIIFLSVISLVLGVIGLMQMEKKLAGEKRRRRNVAAYENPAIHF